MVSISFKFSKYFEIILYQINLNGSGDILRSFDHLFNKFSYFWRDRLTLSSLFNHGLNKFINHHPLPIKIGNNENINLRDYEQTRNHKSNQNNKVKKNISHAIIVKSRLNHFLSKLLIITIYFFLVLFWLRI